MASESITYHGTIASPVRVGGLPQLPRPEDVEIGEGLDNGRDRLSLAYRCRSDLHNSFDGPAVAHLDVGTLVLADEP